MFGHTLREAPADADTPSHALLLRAGFIDQLMAGVYSFMPLGWRVHRKVSAIVREEIEAAGLAKDVWQYFAVMTPVRSTGVMGDYRTYGRVCTIRAITSQDAMTADFARLPWDVLARMSNRIVNEVHGITRVVYDITSKPPATIEWE